MGIWSTAAPMASFIIMPLAPMLRPQVGWRGVWWITCAATLVALVVFWRFIRAEPDGDNPSEKPVKKPSLRLPVEILGNKDIWLAGITIGLFVFVLFSIMTYYPTYLSTERDITAERAGFIMGLSGLAPIAGAPFAGWISDRIGSRKKVIITGFLILIPLYILVFHVPGNLVILTLLLWSFFASSIPVCLFAISSELIDGPSGVVFGPVVLVLGQNLGVIAGPPLFGKLVESVGWSGAAYSFAPLYIVAIVVTMMIRKAR
jgi:ACS family D-galactonate transporter-like MFS transporter